MRSEAEVKQAIQNLFAEEKEIDTEAQPSERPRLYGRNLAQREAFEWVLEPSAQLPASDEVLAELGALLKTAHEDSFYRAKAEALLHEIDDYTTQGDAGNAALMHVYDLVRSGWVNNCSVPPPFAAPALLARVRTAEAFKGQIQARIEALKKEREGYQDQRSEMAHNPDNEEEQEALYVSVRQCDFAIEQLESLLKADGE